MQLKYTNIASEINLTNHTFGLKNGEYYSSIGGQVGWSTLSDERIKFDIQNNVPGLAFINKLSPVTYQYNIDKENILLEAKMAKENNWAGKYDIQKIRFSGFLAQEVETAAKSIGYEFSGVDKPSDSNSLYALRYSDFVVPIVKSIQELSLLVEDLQKQNRELKQELNLLKQTK